MRHTLPDEAVAPQLDAGCGLFRTLHVGEPAETKACVLHSESFFSWVRTWVLPLAKTSVSSCENRSRSCRIFVPSSCSSSQWSVNLTYRQCSILRSSPSPTLPLTIPQLQ